MTKYIRDVARQVTPPVVWNALSHVKSRLAGTVASEVQRYFGLQDLDKKLEKYLNFDGGRFVEIGAWDGVRQSNSLYFERFRSWKGILIEPSPSEFLKCRRNRPDAQVYCYACVPFDYTEAFVPMLFCASMTATNVAGQRRGHLDPAQHVLDGRKFLSEGEEVFAFGAVPRPLSNVIDEAGLDAPLDLLILDVEGFELEVLRGLDFGRHAPRFICVEVWDFKSINSYLTSKGYVHVDQLTQHDHLYELRGHP